MFDPALLPKRVAPDNADRGERTRMNVSPLDLRQQRFRKAFRGFDPIEVTSFLAAVADDYEQALRETDRLRQDLMRMEAVLAERSLRLPRPWPSSPAALLIWRQTSIHNALSYLDALFARDVFEQAHDRTMEATGDRERAQAAGWAAAIAAVMRDVRDGRPPAAPDGGSPVAEAPDAAALVRIAEALIPADGAAAARPRRSGRTGHRTTATSPAPATPSSTRGAERSPHA